MEKRTIIGIGFGIAIVGVLLIILGGIEMSDYREFESDRQDALEACEMMYRTPFLADCSYIEDVENPHPRGWPIMLVGIVVAYFGYNLYTYDQ